MLCDIVLIAQKGIQNMDWISFKKLYCDELIYSFSDRDDLAFQIFFLVFLFLHNTNSMDVPWVFNTTCHILIQLEYVQIISLSLVKVCNYQNRIVWSWNSNGLLLDSQLLITPYDILHQTQTRDRISAPCAISAYHQ